MGPIKKITIFGATGMTGICVLQFATQEGFQTINVFVRDPEKLPDEYIERVQVIKGDVTNSSDVDKAIENVQGVIVVLGTRNKLEPTTELSTGLLNIVTSMKKHHVNVISVCLSAFLFYDPVNVPPVFKNINDEHQRMLDILKATDLQYIAVLPPHIADNPKGEYVVRHGASPGGRIVSKFELADFLVTCLSKPEHHGKVVGICSASSIPRDT